MSVHNGGITGIDSVLASVDDRFPTRRRLHPTSRPTSDHVAFRSFGLRFLHETQAADRPTYRYSHELQVVVHDDPRPHVVLAGTSSGGTDGPTGDEEMDFHQPDDDESR